MISLQSPANALELSKALMQESTTERLHVVSTVNTSLPQPCKVPIRKAVKETVTAIEKALIAEDFIPNQSVVNGATWLS